MRITEKTRKVLWGRSGSLCAFCRTHLVIDSSNLDAESVIGDECHIISGAPTGPRHDPSFPAELIDSVENLLLLCRVHHKQVDDQSETFTAETLRQLKADHEKWVKDRLSTSNETEPVRVVRIASEIPTHLTLVSSAKSLLDLAASCQSHYDNYPDDLTDDELDSIDAFLQNLTDWVDIGLNDPHERISAQRSLAENMQDLDRAGLRVYAAREKQQLRGGAAPPSAFYALHLHVIRHDKTAEP